MEQQSTTSNIVAGEPAQSETNVPQPQQQIPSSEDDAKISFLKPELLRVGFVGFIHNLSLLVLALFEFIFYFGYLLRLLKFRENVFEVVCITLVHFIAIVLSVGAIVMDVFLRESTYPSNGHKQKAKLQHYLIVNMMYFGFGLVMSAVLFFLPSHTDPDARVNPYIHIWLLVSHSLRLVCMLVVFQTWTLLRQRPGFKNYGDFPIPSRGGHNQSSTQTVPSIQVQQQRELEMKAMEQQNTTFNVAAGEAAQPEINMFQQQTQPTENDVLLSTLKPELLRVGLLGLANDLSLLVILLCFLIAWSIGLDYLLKNRYVNVTINYLHEADLGSVFGFMLAHLVGFFLSIGALVMDVILRRSATATSNPNQRFTLQRYLIFNSVCLAFGLFMSLVIHFYVPLTVIGPQYHFSLIISNCLRAGCIFIVYKYWTLLRQMPGFMKFGGFPMPLRGQNQYPAQTVVGPSTQVQRI